MSNLHTAVENRQEAHKLILRRTLYAAGAGLVPVPVVDTAALLGIQIWMVRDISRIYGVEFKQHRVRPLIAALVGDLATSGLVKLIPGAGTIWGSISGAVGGAAITYALGKVFTLHFAQGGTLLDFDPIKSREFFKQEFEKGQEVVTEMTASKVEPEAAAETEIYSYRADVEQKKSLHAELLALRGQLSSLRAQPTTAPVQTEPVVPVENNPAVNPEDLQIVEGIGPKVATALKAAGIRTLNDLAAAQPEDIKNILDKARGNFSLAVPDTWPKQAALAVAGDMEGLKALQEELKGGKEIA